MNTISTHLASAKGPQSKTDEQTSQQKIDTLLKGQKDFQSEMMKQLAGVQSRYPGLGLSGSASMMGGLSSGSPFQLMNLDVEGIEKVWAEQLKTPFGLMSMGGETDRQNGMQHTALDNIIMLTVQEQLTRVNDLVQKRSEALQDKTDGSASESEPESVAGAGLPYRNVQDFSNRMRKEFEQASRQLGVPISVLRDGLDNWV